MGMNAFVSVFVPHVSLGQTDVDYLEKGFPHLVESEFGLHTQPQLALGDLVYEKEQGNKYGAELSWRLGTG